jgi:phosphopantothenoylcysteine decarboxylase/phosphopantothenate--cysteine ligase
VERLAHTRPKRQTQFRLLLEPTEDIAAALGRRKGRRLLIGFAMEDNDPRSHAERKLRKKNCDLIVLNGLETVGSDQASVEFFVPASGWTGPYRGSKVQIARRIIRAIEAMRAEKT